MQSSKKYFFQGMDTTPSSHNYAEDSGCISGSFSTSSFFRSTPNDDFNTPSLPAASRKRKYGQNQLNVKRLQDVIESCPSTPIFSSTLNESLVDNLENCHIKTNLCQDIHRQLDHKANLKKQFSTSKASHILPPATPEKNIYNDETKKIQNGALYNLKFVEESPIKEAHDILYANLKTNVKKTFSPLKFRESFEKYNSPAKKCLFDSSEKLRTSKLFSQVTSNPVVMDVIFSFLSDGDLYRLSLASSNLKQAICQNVYVRHRYEVFMEVHRENKENYKVTPPRSPEKSDSPPGSPSRFNEYVKMAKRINPNQSLTKCPSCGKPSIVENSIGQCQNRICGYIYCRKCFSSSRTGPEDFYDRCQSSALVKNKTRTLLSDMSNNDISTGRSSIIESSSQLYSIFHSPKSSRNFEDSSGFISENEYSPKHFQVRKNLSQKLKNVRPSTKVFHLFNDVVPSTVPLKKRTSLGTVPVISIENRRLQDFDPPSPPKIRSIACSQQSKRNLKRLTR